MKKIKEIRQYNARTTDPSFIPDQWFLRAISRFDINENIISEVLYESAEILESKTEFRYDTRNRLIEKLVFFSEDIIGEKFNFDYDDQNRLITESLIYEDGSVSKKSYSYLPDKIIINITDEDNNLESQEIKKLENDLLVEEIVYDENGNITQHFSIEYDNHGKMISRIEFDSSGTIISIRKYVYEPEGQLIEMTETTGNNELITQRTFQYDEQHRLIRESVDGYLINYFYNDAGKRIREEIINPAGVIESFTEYEYEGEVPVKTISCNKGNLLIQESSGKGIRSAFLISRFEYDYYSE